MFSLFSKSSRFVSKNPSENSDLIRNCSGSIGTLTADRGESPSLYMNNQFEVKSSVSVNANISESKKIQEEEKEVKKQKLSRTFQL